MVSSTSTTFIIASSKNTPVFIYSHPSLSLHPSLSPSVMDHRHGRRSLSTIMDEETRLATQSPPHLAARRSYSTSNTTTTMNTNLMPPPSPDSPWTLSPNQTPSPSLLYHCITSLHRHEGIIHSIAASNGTVFTGSDSRKIRAWRQPNLTEWGYLKAGSGNVRAVLCHGNLLFTSHNDHYTRIWKVPDTDNFQSQKVKTLPRRSLFFKSQTLHKDCVSCMAYYHAEGILYTGSWDKTVKAWKVSSNKCVDSFLAHEDRVNAIIVNQIDGHLFTCSSDGSIKIWRRVLGQSSHTLTTVLKFQPSPVNALAISAYAISSSANSCFLYSGSSDGFINFWEKERSSGRFNHGGFLQGHRFSVLCLAAIEKLVFSGSEDTTIRVWRREEGSYFHECLAVLDAHRGPVRCLAACLEVEKVVFMGFLVYSAGLDQTLKVWRVKVMPDTDDQNGAGTGGTQCRSSCTEVKMNGNVEYEMSPVLSPSWVSKKLQGAHHPFSLVNCNDCY